MTRYRVGNKFLSESEYYEDTITSWALVLFVVGSIIFGLISNSLLLELELQKWIRFTLVISGSVMFGLLLGRFAELIRNIVLFSLCLAVLGGIGYFIWNII